MDVLLQEATSLYGLAAILIISINATLFWVAGIRLAPGALPDARHLSSLLRKATGQVATIVNDQLRRRFAPADGTELPPLPPLGA